MKLYEVCSSNHIFERARRYISRNFHEYLTEKCGQKFNFKIFNKLLTVDEIVLTDRKNNKIYQIDMEFAQEDLERSISINLYLIIDIDVHQIHINNSGNFIAIIFKIVYRDEFKSKEMYKTIYAPKIEKVEEFREV